MMLILVMAFFMLGCRFSCSGMKEGFNEAGFCKMACQKSCCAPFCKSCASSLSAKDCAAIL